MKRPHLHQVAADTHVAPAASVSLARIVKEEPALWVGALSDERRPAVTKKARRGFRDRRDQLARTTRHVAKALHASGRLRSQPPAQLPFVILRRRPPEAAPCDSHQPSSAREIIEAWRHDYNWARPHLSLAARTPREFADQQGDGPLEQVWGSAACPLAPPSHQGQNINRLYL